MTDLDKAREWAKGVGKIEDLMSEPRAAVEVIQSLPDQWVDVEKLKAIIADMDLCLKMESTSDFSKGIDNATTSWRDALKALIAPKLPTLVEMTLEERKACVGMQADYVELGVPVKRVVIMGITEFGAILMSQNWECSNRYAGHITPLPDLPKLQWPGGEPESTHFDNLPDEAKQVMKESIEDFKAGQFVDFDSSPRPEDVPAGEPWIVEYDGIRHVGAREKGAVTYLDWALARLDGTECVAARDREITLVSRLVPESHTLPEGMRLADHETYGRVVVSPEVDHDGDYKVFLSGSEEIAGASWRYANKSELDFLDGEA